MRNRLDITLFGTLYVVCALRLPNAAVKKGIDVYGPKEWNQRISRIALHPMEKKLAVEVGHTIGHPIETVHRSRGIALHDTAFGLEVFHRGQFTPLDFVEAQNRTLQPDELMQGYRQKDMLGVFWAKCDGVVSYRFEDVEKLSPQDVELTYDSLGALLGRKRPFDVVTDVTWQGHKGKRKEPGPDGPLMPLKHVFHVVK